MADNTEGNLALFQKLTQKKPEDHKKKSEPKVEHQPMAEPKIDDWLSVYNDFLFKDL